jgi:hypothetical protein
MEKDAKNPTIFARLSLKKLIQVALLSAVLRKLWNDLITPFQY